MQQTINTEESNKRDKLYKYAEAIVNAKIDGGAKALLWQYAFAYNWKRDGRSFWTEARICAAVGMAPSTYQKRKRYLEQFGWIDVVKIHWKRPSFIRPTIGRDDPNYEKRHWAKWHPSNIKSINLAEISTLSDSELKSFTVTKPLEGLPVIEEEHPDYRWEEIEEVNLEEW